MKIQGDKVALEDANPFHRRCVWCKRTLAFAVYEDRALRCTGCNATYVIEIFEQITEQEWFDILQEKHMHVSLLNDGKEIYITSEGNKQ